MPPLPARVLSLSLSLLPSGARGSVSLSLSLYQVGSPGCILPQAPRASEHPHFSGVSSFPPQNFPQRGSAVLAKVFLPPTRSVELSHDDHDKVRLIAHSCGQVLGDCYFWATTSNCRKLQTDHHESPPGYVPVLLCLSTCSLSFDRVKDKRVCSLSLSLALSRSLALGPAHVMLTEFNHPFLPAKIRKQRSISPAALHSLSLSLSFFRQGYGQRSLLPSG